jgi:hypothetical protein
LHTLVFTRSSWYMESDIPCLFVAENRVKSRRNSCVSVINCTHRLFCFSLSALSILIDYVSFRQITGQTFILSLDFLLQSVA